MRHADAYGKGSHTAETTCLSDACERALSVDQIALGSQSEAEDAYDRLLRAKNQGALDCAGSGVFDGWHWWRGASRVVWLPPHGNVVYKIGHLGNDENMHEAENMHRWRQDGRSWAPRTQSYRVGGHEVLAMPYSPEAIDSADEIPPDARYTVPDQSIQNFRRRQDGLVMVIDAGDPAPY